MAYSNSEQIFMDVLGGRSPSPFEQKQIDALLAILQRAGFVVDEPSNAAHVTLLAWGWARETGRGDVLTALHNNNQAIDVKMDVRMATIHQSIEKLHCLVDIVRELKDSPQPTVSLDSKSVAANIIQSMPPPTANISIDTSVLKEAVMESVSKLWLILAGVGLVVCFWAGMEWAQHQIQPVIGQLQLQISQMQTQNQQLINKLSDGHHAH